MRPIAEKINLELRLKGCASLRVVRCTHPPSGYKIENVAFQNFQMSSGTVFFALVTKTALYTAHLSWPHISPDLKLRLKECASLRVVRYMHASWQHISPGRGVCQDATTSATCYVRPDKYNASNINGNLLGYGVYLIDESGRSQG